MVPCQPRQLVILSLPFAALVAFFWYRRRKSLSRSDPGGTLAPTKPVDKAVKIISANNNATDAELTALDENKSSDKTVENCYLKSIENICDSNTHVEKSIVKEIEDVAKLSQKGVKIIDEPIIVAVKEEPVKTILAVEKEEIICNGAVTRVKEYPEDLNIIYKEVVNSPLYKDSPSTNNIFHSTLIEDEKEFEDSTVNQSERDRPVKEVVQSVKVEELETVGSFNSVKNHQEKKSLAGVEVEKRSIPIEEQSTVENVALTKVNYVDIKDESALAEETDTELIVDDILLKTDINIKDISSKTSDSLDRVEDISTDTGVGSQDPSTAEETSSMAQGQKTKEKSESNAAGLEQKLANLGLDTQQPPQRAERDSANHSPAEVMLNSPAISTFSDAHSEVVKWLNQCNSGSCLKSQKVEPVHIFYPFLFHPGPYPNLRGVHILIQFGSSDSGKGCSDVVTPPSRTPAGGSSVAGDQVPSIYEFVLPQVIVGRLIGRHGAFLHDIRAKTHTNVFIKRHPETNTLKICAIEGTQADIDAALKMIRHKFPLRRFPDLTLERVTFVKNSCLPISPENLQLHLVEGVNNDVILSSLITAGHFFLQLPMHMSYQSLYRLACIMNTVYSTQESPPLPDPQPDVVCVAPAHGGWYRAQILSVDEEASTSDIRFLDYGGFLTVDNSLLRQIRGDFLMLPFQAVECALANVVPAGGEEEWSEEAKQFVQLMTTQQTLQAQVYDYTDSGLPLVYLYCTQFYQSPNDSAGFETKVVLLNQEMVSRGFADLIDPQEEPQMTATDSS